MPEHKHLPFIAYAVDSPDCSTRPGESGRQPGTTILVSGGYYRKSCTDGHAVELFQSGLLDTPDPLGRCFTELAANALLEENDRVLLYRNLSWSAATEPQRWLETARTLGFDTLETRDAHNELIGALCIGRADMLADLSWFDENTDAWANQILISSQDQKSRFERLLLQNAREGADISKPISDFLSKVIIDRRAISEELENYSLLAYLMGEDGSNLEIMHHSASLPDITKRFIDIASTLGVALYYGGEIKKPDTEGKSFADYATCPNWRPLPTGWLRIA